MHALDVVAACPEQLDDAVGADEVQGADDDEMPAPVGEHALERGTHERLRFVTSVS